MEQHEKNEFEKFEKRHPEFVSDTATEEDELDSAIEDLFDQWSDELDEELDAEFEDGLEDEFNWNLEDEERDAQTQQEMDKLLKSSSINKLFRRLTRALHPDLVQSETEKEQRHHLMTELMNARKNKDIVKIIAMYTEHVGEAPTDLFNNDFEKMTKLLKFRVDQLKQQKEEIIHEDPRRGAIYHQFYDPSPKKVQRAVNERRNSVQAQLDALQTTTNELTSLKKLKPLLRAMAEGFVMP